MLIVTSVFTCKIAPVFEEREPGNGQESLAERPRMLRHRVLMQRHGFTSTEGDPLRETHDAASGSCDVAYWVNSRPLTRT